MGTQRTRPARYRYIHYVDGSEELYDHEKDLKEWDNLANNPEFEALKKSFKAQLPETYAEKSMGVQQRIRAKQTTK